MTVDKQKDFGRDIGEVIKKHCAHLQHYEMFGAFVAVISAFIDTVGKPEGQVALTEKFCEMLKEMSSVDLKEEVGKVKD